MFEIYFEELHYLIMLLLHNSGEFISSDKMNGFPESGFFLHFTFKKKKKVHIQEVGLSNSVFEFDSFLVM